MDLCGEASPGPAQGVISGLGLNPTRRLLLSLSMTAGARGVLMGPADRGVDVDLPRDQPGRIRSGLQLGQQDEP
jgi:hypothetical protein